MTHTTELETVLHELRQLEPLVYAANDGAVRSHFERLLAACTTGRLCWPRWSSASSSPGRKPGTRSTMPCARSKPTTFC